MKEYIQDETPKNEIKAYSVCNRVEYSYIGSVSSPFKTIIIVMEDGKFSHVTLSDRKGDILLFKRAHIETMEQVISELVKIELGALV